MPYICFKIDKELEDEFRKLAGQIYGARRNAIGNAIRDAIKEFIKNNGGGGKHGATAKKVEEVTDESEPIEIY